LDDAPVQVGVVEELRLDERLVHELVAIEADVVVADELLRARAQPAADRADDEAADELVPGDAAERDAAVFQDVEDALSVSPAACESTLPVSRSLTRRST